MLDAGTFGPIQQPVDNSIKAMWVFDWKADTYGRPTKTKARLIARGDEQSAHIDFRELFAPTGCCSECSVVDSDGVRARSWFVPFDIEQAFVQSDLEKNVSMGLPQGCGGNSGKIVKLNKSVYGLKQASRQWHAQFTRYWLTILIRFAPCLTDACLFRLMDEGRVVMTIVVRVDYVFAVG